MNADIVVNNLTVRGSLIEGVEIGKVNFMSFRPNYMVIQSDYKPVVSIVPRSENDEIVPERFVKDPELDPTKIAPLKYMYSDKEDFSLEFMETDWKKMVVSKTDAFKCDPRDIYEIYSANYKVLYTMFHHFAGIQEIINQDKWVMSYKMLQEFLSSAYTMNDSSL